MSTAPELDEPWGPGLPPGEPGKDWPIRVAGGTWAPFVYPCAEDKPVLDEERCPIAGLSAEVLHYALKAAKLEYEIIPQPNPVADWGTIVDAEKGIVSGLFAGLQNGTYDVILSTYTMSDIRNRFIDHSFPLLMNRQRLGYIMQKPGEGLSVSSTQLLFKIFTANVWLAFGGLFLGLMFVLCLVRIHTKRRHLKFNMDDLVDEESLQSGWSAAWDVVMMAVDQFHGDMGTGRLSGNIAMLSIGFLCLFLHTIYEGYLVTMMLRQTAGVPFRGMSDLAPLIDSGQYRMATYSLGDIFITQVMNAETAQHRLMKEAIEKNPIWVAEDSDWRTVIKAVEEDSSLIFGAMSEMESVAMLRGHCSLIWLPDQDVSETTYQAFLTQKNSKIGKKITEAMTGMVSFMVYIGEKYFKHELKEDTCDRSSNVAKEGMTVLKVSHYYGLFFLGLLGVGLSLVVFGVELIKHRLQKPKQANKWEKTQRKIQAVNMVANKNGIGQALAEVD